MLRRNPDFFKLWAGQAISQIGSHITREGLPLTAVLLLGASPWEMGILSGVGGAAVLVCGLFAGVWVDRLRRRSILIATDLGRGFLLATIPLTAALHRLTIPYLCIVAAASAVLTLLFDVAYQAYVPALVERENVLRANSRLALMESMAEVLGPGLTGLLVQLLTAPIAILFDALSFLVSAFSLSIIRRPEPDPEGHSVPHMGREIAEGLRACLHDPVLRALAARTAVAALFLGAPAGLYILFAIRELGLNAAMLGLIIAVGGASNLLGSIVTQRLVGRFGFGPVLIGSAVAAGSAALIVPLARGPVALACVFLTLAQLGDLAWPIYTIAETSLRQLITPSHLLGRVNSAMHLLFRGLLPVGSIAGGALAEVAGLRAAMLAGAIGFLLSSLCLVFSPLRALRRDAQPALRERA